MNPRSTDCNTDALTTTPLRQYGICLLLHMLAYWPWNVIDKLSQVCRYEIKTLLLTRKVIVDNCAVVLLI